VSVRIGLIMPCDMTLDGEYWRMAPPGTTVHPTRTGFHEGDLDADFVRGVSDLEEIGYAARSLTKIDPHAIAFACTSGSFIDGLAGERAIRDAMLGAGARAAVTTSGSLLDALAYLGARRVCLGTPYADEIARELPPFLATAGYEPFAAANLELPDVIDEVAAEAVTALAEAAHRPGADAMFLACTGVPTLELLGDLEARFGMPVLSANQVTMWGALRAAGSDPGHPRDLLRAVPAAA
jgi:maleate isomerase